jgi:hypothetical protein
MDFVQLEQVLEKLMAACEADDEQRIYGLLADLVPEHQSHPSFNTTTDADQNSVVVPIKNPQRPL